MRRKSTRNTTKVSPEKIKEEIAPKRGRRQTKKYKESSSSDSDSDKEINVQKPATVIEEEDSSTSALSNPETSIKDAQDEGTVEPQKGKLSLICPTPNTPERTRRRLRNKPGYQEEQDAEEKVTRRTRRRAASPKKEDIKEDTKGKGKSKGKLKSKIDESSQITEVEMKAEISENVQVTAQSPQNDNTDVENIHDGLSKLEDVKNAADDGDTEIETDNNKNQGCLLKDLSAEQSSDKCEIQQKLTEIENVDQITVKDVTPTEIVDISNKPTSDEHDVIKPEETNQGDENSDIGVVDEEVAITIKNDIGESVPDKKEAIDTKIDTECENAKVENESPVETSTENIEEQTQDEIEANKTSDVTNKPIAETVVSVNEIIEAPDKSTNEAETVSSADTETVGSSNRSEEDQNVISNKDDNVPEKLQSTTTDRTSVEENVNCHKMSKDEKVTLHENKEERVTLHENKEERVTLHENKEERVTLHENKEEMATPHENKEERVILHENKEEDRVTSPQNSEEQDVSLHQNSAELKVSDKIEEVSPNEHLEKMFEEKVVDVQSSNTNNVTPHITSDIDDDKQSADNKHTETQNATDISIHVVNENIQAKSEEDKTQTKENIIENVNVSDKPSIETEKVDKPTEETSKISTTDNSKHKITKQHIELRSQTINSELNGSSQDKKEHVNRKWSTSVPLYDFSRLVNVSLHNLKAIYPEAMLLAEDDVKLDLKLHRDRKASAAERYELKRKQRRDTEEEKEKAEGEEKKEESANNVDNIIAMNRKISIVSDDASKLRPPPSPAKNDKTEVLFLTNLVRPFTIKQLKELLERTGNIVEDGFWTDKIKSKCYVHYQTVDEAEATRNALHGVHWPIGNGKKLMIEYSTKECLENAKNPPPPPPPPQAPVNVPKTAGKENEEPDVKRVRVENEKIDEVKTKPIPHDESKKVDVSRGRSKSKSRLEKRRYSRHSRSPSADIQRKQKKVEDLPQRAMDDLFKKTEATPCIYWQPLSPTEIALKQQQRLERMAEHKRRMETHTRVKRGSDHPRGVSYRRRY